MSVKYNILLRVCDKVESVHKVKRPFNLNKLQTIKVSFYSMYQSLQGSQYQITIIGDDLSSELLDFIKTFDDVIIDNSNGKNHVGRKEGYYKAGQINPKERGAYVEYDKEETLIKMARNKHWGPWDLNEKLEEDVPNEPSEIGKKRLKISALELKGIK